MTQTAVKLHLLFDLAEARAVLPRAWFGLNCRSSAIKHGITLVSGHGFERLAVVLAVQNDPLVVPQ